MRIYFPGGKKVYADYKGFTIKTDQPVNEGRGVREAPRRRLICFYPPSGPVPGYTYWVFVNNGGLTRKVSRSFNPL